MLTDAKRKHPPPPGPTWLTAEVKPGERVLFLD